MPSASIGDIRVDKMFFVQIADAPLLTMDYLCWSRHFRNMPGQGDFPLAEFVAAIHRLGYDGYWSLEIFNDRFRRGPRAAWPSTASVRCGCCKIRWRSARVRRSRPRCRRGSMCNGVEFIEFAANDEEAQALGSMLSALGFTPTSTHRRKAVTRWQQGDINS